jgi:hypothetical protein
MRRCSLPIAMARMDHPFGVAIAERVAERFVEVS